MACTHTSHTCCRTAALAVGCTLGQRQPEQSPSSLTAQHVPLVGACLCSQAVQPQQQRASLLPMLYPRAAQHPPTFIWRLHSATSLGTVALHQSSRYPTLNTTAYRRCMVSALAGLGKLHRHWGVREQMTQILH